MTSESAQYMWMSGLYDNGKNDRGFGTFLAERVSPRLWQNASGLYSLACPDLSPFKDIIYALTAAAVVEFLKKYGNTEIKFNPRWFFPMRKSMKEYNKAAVERERLWPIFLRDIPEKEYVKNIYSQVTSPQPGALSGGMERTRRAILDAGRNLVDLDFVRLVSRADIEWITSELFKDRVVDLASGEIRIYFASDDCFRYMAKEEVYSYDNFPFIRKFVDLVNGETSSKVIPENDWEPRYFNSTLALMTNLVALRPLLTSKKGNVKVFLYKGNGNATTLPTLRATLIKNNNNNREVDKAFASLMPEKATGMASTIISIDQYFEKAQAELYDLRPGKPINVDRTIPEYREICQEFCETELMKLTGSDKNTVLIGLKNLSQPYQSKNIQGCIQIMEQLQNIVTRAYERPVEKLRG